jgi:hypothetical protein
MVLGISLADAFAKTVATNLFFYFSTIFISSQYYCKVSLNHNLYIFKVWQKHKVYKLVIVIIVIGENRGTKKRRNLSTLWQTLSTEKK